MPSQILYSNPNTGTVTVINGDGSTTLLPGSPISPFLQFPVLGTKYAAANFSRKNLDQTILNETDGGYEYTRPKNTNFKRRDWSLGFSLMPDSELQVLRGFVEEVGNCGGCFSWVDPTTQEMYLCRFTTVPNEVYVGFGSQSFMWNVDFKIRSIKLLSLTYTGYVLVLPFGPQTGGLYYSASLTPAIPTSSLFAFFVNGLLVPLTKYTMTTPNTITLTDGVASDDILLGFAYTPKFSGPPGPTTLATLTGTVDGVNRTFTSSISTTGATLVMLFYNGLLVDPNKYTCAGATVIVPVAPLTGDAYTMYVWS